MLKIVKNDSLRVVKFGSQLPVGGLFERSNGNPCMVISRRVSASECKALDLVSKEVWLAKWDVKYFILSGELKVGYLMVESEDY